MIRVKSANLLKNPQGCALCALYNEGGNKILNKGEVIPAPLAIRSVYIPSSSTSLIKTSNSTGVKTKGADDELLLKGYYSQKMITLYHQVASRMEEILTNRNFTSETLGVAEDIVEECYSADYFELRSILFAIRKKNEYTSNHSFSLFLLFLQAVNNFKESIYEEGFYDSFKQRSNKINFNRDSIKKYALGALLHDYGKVFIPDEILNKPGKLTPAEYDEVRKHPIYGVKALMQAGIEDKDLLSIVGDHHGSYRLFQREEPNPLAQICNVLDIYDASQTKRVYRDAMSHEDSIRLLYAEKQNLHWSDYIFNHLVKRTIPEFQKKDFSKAS